jgi:type IV secretory pathway VirB2 component (pilin)
MNEADVRARNRFIVIQIVRISGVAMVLLGLLVMTGRIDWPRELGYILAVVGMFEALLFPLLLSRRWKSPSE